MTNTLNFYTVVRVKAVVLTVGLVLEKRSLDTEHNDTQDNINNATQSKMTLRVTSLDTAMLSVVKPNVFYAECHI